jgi:hypothetical protein
MEKCIRKSGKNPILSLIGSCDVIGVIRNIGFWETKLAIFTSLVYFLRRAFLARNYSQSLSTRCRS